MPEAKGRKRIRFKPKEGDLIQTCDADPLLWTDVENERFELLGKGELLLFIRDEGKMGMKVLSSTGTVGNMSRIYLEPVKN